MKKILLMAIVLAILSLAGNQAVKAQDVSNEAKETPELSMPQDAGNKFCPVRGEKIDEKTKVTYEYEGKTYNFCCAFCVDEFKRDPQKYLKKMEEQEQAAPKKEDTQDMKMLENAESADQDNNMQ